MKEATSEHKGMCFYRTLGTCCCVSFIKSCGGCTDTHGRFDRRTQWPRRTGNAPRISGTVDFLFPTETANRAGNSQRKPFVVTKSKRKVNSDWSLDTDMEHNRNKVNILSGQLNWANNFTNDWLSATDNLRLDKGVAAASLLIASRGGANPQSFKKRALTILRLEPEFPNWGTCTPSGAFAYLKGYV